MVLGASLASQTLILIVNYDYIDTLPLPGISVTFSVDCKFLIIALMVGMGIFTALALFLKPLQVFVKLNYLLLYIRNIFFGF